MRSGVAENTRGTEKGDRERGGEEMHYLNHVCESLILYACQPIQEDRQTEGRWENVEKRCMGEH